MNLFVFVHVPVCMRVSVSLWVSGGVEHEAVTLASIMTGEGGRREGEEDVATPLPECGVEQEG